MIDRIREMPGGIRLFLAYAFLILAGIGLSLRFVVDQAISAPVSLPGVVVMVLLAYTIFTTTLVLQRKQAARNLALGLASLTVPLIPLLLLSGLVAAGHLRHGARDPALPRAAATGGPGVPERGVTRREPAAGGAADGPSRNATRPAGVPSRRAATVAAGSSVIPRPFRPHLRHPREQGFPPAPAARHPTGHRDHPGARLDPGGTAVRARGPRRPHRPRPWARGTTSRTSGQSTRPSQGPGGTSRAGRRPTARTYRHQQRPFVERYRGWIVVVAALAGVALIALFVFSSAAAPAYACSTLFDPAPTASPAAGQTPSLGYPQDDMGNKHVAVGDQGHVHVLPAGAAATTTTPRARARSSPACYGPNDKTIPQGWVHNLEHGALVLLYRGDSEGATPEGQQQLQAFFAVFPPSPVCNVAAGHDRRARSSRASTAWRRRSRPSSGTASCRCRTSTARRSSRSTSSGASSPTRS